MKTAYELLKKMAKKPIKYGWYDYVHKIKITPDMSEFTEHNYFEKYCRVLKPIETFSYGIGTCWDTTLLTWFELNRIGLNPKSFYVETDNMNMTHCATYYKDAGMLFWLEYSWWSKQGIHGPYKSEEQFFDILLNEYFKKDDRFKNIHSFNKSFNVNAIININDKISADDFINIARKPY